MERNETIIKEAALELLEILKTGEPKGITLDAFKEVVKYCENRTLTIHVHSQNILTVKMIVPIPILPGPRFNDMSLRVTKSTEGK